MSMAAPRKKPTRVATIPRLPLPSLLSVENAQPLFIAAPTPNTAPPTKGQTERGTAGAEIGCAPPTQ